jgi:hypothetical protein
MLAADLRDALERYADVQSQVDDVLANLFPGWRPRFPPELGWRFIPPGELHIYEAVDVPGAAAALRFIGFASVTVHPHAATKFLECRCMPARFS